MGDKVRMVRRPDTQDGQEDIPGLCDDGVVVPPPAGRVEPVNVRHVVTGVGAGAAVGHDTVEAVVVPG